MGVTTGCGEDRPKVVEGYEPVRAIEEGEGKEWASVPFDRRSCGPDTSQAVGRPSGALVFARPPAETLEDVEYPSGCGVAGGVCVAGVHDPGAYEHEKVGARGRARRQAR